MKDVFVQHLPQFVQGDPGGNFSVIGYPSDGVVLPVSDEHRDRGGNIDPDGPQQQGDFAVE